jgi:vancomycin aglycone glucosyltransferase
LSSGVIIASDAEIAPVPRDATVRCVQTGYWVPPASMSAPLPDAVERFLAAGPPPIYFGFGSMPDHDLEATHRAFVQAAGAVGRRALVATARPTRALSGSGDVFTLGAVSHALLFPRLAAVVHHGGAGTTATAARAGVPQIVVPHVLDQAYWGRRVEQLGIGARAVMRAQLTRETLARALANVLTDGSVLARARALGEALRGRDGIGDAIAALQRERLL